MNEFLNTIKEFFNNNLVATIILDIYLAIFILSFVIYLAFKYRRALILTFIGILMVICYMLSTFLGLKMSEAIYTSVMNSYVIICFIILAPDIRKLLDYHKKNDNKNDMILSTTSDAKLAICDAVFNMSKQKVGALITLEQHNSLEQYSDNAITLNSDISRELIEQIFVKDSPLHDGGVIIRGNKIICAGAYYTLTQDNTLDKTVGSRHRAGLGISELTDSLTIIVSEETGDVHVTHSGFMKLMGNKNELLEYLDLYLGR